jgi:hypothetical protein
MTADEAQAEFDRLEQQHQQDAPQGFWARARFKFNNLLRQGVAQAQDFLRWLRSEFLLFWEEAGGREIAFSALATKMAAHV